MVGWSWSWGIRLGLRVDSGSLVGDISDVSVISVGGVLDVLDSAVGKSHGVSTLDITGTIGSLLSVEVGLGVVIGNGVGEGVGGNLIGVLLGLVGGGGGVSGGGLHNHGGVDSVGNNWGGVDSVSHGVDGVVGDGVDGVVDHRGVVDSVVDGSVVEHMLDSSVGGSQGENSSSNKSLKLLGLNAGSDWRTGELARGEERNIYLHFCSIVV